MKNFSSKIVCVFAFATLLISCQNDDNSNTPVTPVTPNAIDCIPVNLQNSLIAFFPFSNGSLNDASGNNYHLTNPTTASPGADRNGNATCAYSFDALNDDYLTFVNPTFINDFDTNPFSISLWFKTIGNRDGGVYEQLIGRDTGLHCPDTFGQWSIGLYDCRNLVLGINDYNLWGGTVPSYYGDTNCANSPTLNVWHHVVVTSDGTPGGIQMFINGNLTTSTSGTGCGVNQGTNNIGDLFLGKQLTGLLDDVAIFNRVLTNAEINSLSDLGTCCM